MPTNHGGKRVIPDAEARQDGAKCDGSSEGIYGKVDRSMMGDASEFIRRSTADLLGLGAGSLLDGTVYCRTESELVVGRWARYYRRTQYYHCTVGV